MAIIRGPRPETSFYTVDKQISEDERLSWAARGLLIFLLGKPDGWSVSVPALVNETQFAIRGQVGRAAVKAILAELGEAGYLTRSEKPKRKPDGTVDGWDYFISEVPVKQRTYRLKALRNAKNQGPAHFTSPCVDYPHAAEPHTVEPHAAKSHLVNNEFEVKNEVNQTPPSSPAAPAKAEPDEAEKPGQTYPPEFLAFWDAYPRKQGKLAAFKRWTAALSIIGGKRSEAVTILINGAQRYAKEVVGLEREKIKMAEGWLNAGRWEDEDVPEAANVPLEWTKSAPGLDAKAKSLGIPPRASDENGHAFRLRVLVAAGPGPWQDEEIARAMRDNAHDYVKHLRKVFGLIDPNELIPPPATAALAAKTAPPPAFADLKAQLKAKTAGADGGN